MKTFISNLIFVLFVLFIMKSTLAQEGFSKVYEIPWVSLQSSSIIKTFDNNLMIGGSYEYESLILKINPDGDIIWNKTYGYNTYEPTLRIKKLLDSTYLLVSAYSLYETQEDVMSFVKMTENGDTLWTSLLTLTNNLSNYSIEQVYDSGFIISSGIYTGESSPYSDMLIIKLDNYAQFEWAKTIEILNNTNAACSVKQTADSSYIISGYAYNNDENFSELVLFKLSTDGDIIWSKSYRYPDVYWNKCAVTVSNDTLLLVAGTNNYAFILKTTGDGEIIWSKKYYVNTEYSQSFINISLYSMPNNELAILIPDNLIKIDTDGEVIWSTDFWMYVSDFAVLNNEEFYVSGNGPIFGVKASAYEPPQIGLNKLDSNGINNTECIFGGSLSDEVVSFTTDTIIMTAADVVFTNRTNSINFSSSSITATNKCVDFIGSSSELVESDFNIFPNPNNGNFELEYSHNQKILKVQVFNTSGKLVYEQTNLSDTNLNINIRERLPGIYLLKIFSENSYVCKKLIIN